MTVHRTLGSKNKYKSDIKFYESVWGIYIRKKQNLLPYSKFTKIKTELMKGFSEMLINDDYIYIPKLGYFGIGLKETRKRIKRTNWVETYKLWNQLYPNIEKEELKEIKDKPFVLYKNNGTTKYNVVFIKETTLRKRIKFLPVTKIKKQLGTMYQKRLVMSTTDFKTFINALRKNTKSQNR